MTKRREGDGYIIIAVLCVAAMFLVELYLLNVPNRYSYKYNYIKNHKNEIQEGFRIILICPWHLREIFKTGVSMIVEQLPAPVGYIRHRQIRDKELEAVFLCFVFAALEPFTDIIPSAACKFLRLFVCVIYASFLFLCKNDHFDKPLLSELKTSFLEEIFRSRYLMPYFIFLFSDRLFRFVNETVMSYVNSFPV